MFRTAMLRLARLGAFRVQSHRLLSDGVGSEPKRLKVLFGSQTGNSELFARRLTKEARKKFGYNVDICDLYEYNPVCMIFVRKASPWF
jgi:sulfite reductase alpha subunit-like flavoprotein